MSLKTVKLNDVEYPIFFGNWELRCIGQDLKHQTASETIAAVFFFSKYQGLTEEERKKIDISWDDLEVLSLVLFYTLKAGHKKDPHENPLFDKEQCFEFVNNAEVLATLIVEICERLLDKEVKKKAEKK
jgi:hypothetical protein